MKMENKNTEIIKEVMDEIDSALKDPNGINSHQRRIAFSLSLGVVFLIEEYFITVVIISRKFERNRFRISYCICAKHNL